MAGGNRAFMHTPEYKQKMSFIMKGRKKQPFTTEHRANLSKAFTGRIVSDETKKKMSKAQKIAQNRPERKEQISAQHLGNKYCLNRKPWNKGKSLPEIQNEKHVNWKGDQVGYRALHAWLYRHLGQPKECTQCGFVSDNGRQFNWANVSHLYKRDLTDWVRLCVKCHTAYDSGKIQLIESAG